MDTHFISHWPFFMSMQPPAVRNKIRGTQGKRKKRTANSIKLCVVFAFDCVLYFGISVFRTEHILLSYCQPSAINIISIHEPRAHQFNSLLFIVVVVIIFIILIRYEWERRCTTPVYSRRSQTISMHQSAQHAAHINLQLILFRICRTIHIIYYAFIRQITVGFS